MQTSHARGFLAAAPGPRISHRPRFTAEAAWLDRTVAPPAQPSDLGVASWLDLMRWPVGPPGRSRHLAWITGGVAGLTGLLLLLSVPWFLCLVPAVAGTVALWRDGGDRRRSRATLRALENRLASGTAVRDVTTELAAALAVDPGNDAARFLLAASRLEEKEALGALLQLAPLRDRYPDHGEVVLLAACAYAQLGLHRDCLRMIDALDTPRRHPVYPAVVRMRVVVRRALNRHDDAGLQGETRD